MFYQHSISSCYKCVIRSFTVKTQKISLVNYQWQQIYRWQNIKFCFCTDCTSRQTQNKMLSLGIIRYYQPRQICMYSLSARCYTIHKRIQFQHTRKFSFLHCATEATFNRRHRSHQRNLWVILEGLCIWWSLPIFVMYSNCGLSFVVIYLLFTK